VNICKSIDLAPRAPLSLTYSQSGIKVVTPAESGVQKCLFFLDPGFRWNGQKGRLFRSTQSGCTGVVIPLARLKQIRGQETGIVEDKCMNWIEIIKLRSSGKAPQPLKTFFSEIGKNGQRGLREIRIYRHAAWETDWSLHLHWESEWPEKNGSALGLRLSKALDEFGLIDHSTWIEEV
jgi:hypothetical protein